MAVDLISEVWSELKRYITTPDRLEAADTLVAVMIDHDHSPEEIRSAFKSDSDVKQALQSYIDSDQDEDDDDDYRDDNDDDY